MDWGGVGIAAACVYVAMSCAAFVMHWVDKRRALRAGGARRIPERSLHAAALLGGWPGSLVAMRALRHKRRKAGFVAATWGIALLHALAWAIVALMMMRA